MAGDNISKLAVLIDADNAQFSIINLLLSEIAKYGAAFAKRAYGDLGFPTRGYHECKRSHSSGVGANIKSVGSHPGIREKEVACLFPIHGTCSRASIGKRAI